MIKKIVFYNRFGAGDIFVSKEYVRWIVKNIPCENYSYAHRWGSKILQDIPEIKNIEYNELSYPAGSSWWIKENCLYINTWYGVDNYRYLKQGTTLQTLHNLFKTSLKELCNIDLDLSIENFIPFIDFSKFNIKEVDNFISTRGYRKKILVVNHHASSGQAVNFNMNNAIDRLSSEYPEIDFYISSFDIDTPLQFKQNLFPVSIIHNQSGKDFNEVAYIGTKCDIIVGRGSGAYTFCFNRTILKNNTKFIGFCIIAEPVDFGLPKVDQNLKDKFLQFIEQDEYCFYDNLSKIIKEV